MYSILLVEDNASDATVIQFLARQMGFKLDWASNPIDAHELVKKNKYHLMLLDWQLPHLSGLEYLKSLKRDPAFRNLAVIMLSGRSDLKDVKTAAREGVTDYIVKPVDPLIFKTKVMQTLQKYSGSGWAMIPVPASLGGNVGAVSCGAVLLGLNEVEIEFSTPNLLAKELTYSVSFDVLSEFEISSLEVKIVSLEPIAESNQFRVRAHLLALKDTQLQKIRLVCRMFQTQKEVVNV